MPPSAHIDISDRLDPMSVKELRQCLRRPSFVYPFLLIHLFATSALVSEFQLGYKGTSSNVAVVGNLSAFSPIWWVALIICGILMPLAGLLMMRQEIDEGNHEILLLTNITRWRIVLGKFLTLVSLSFLAFTCLIPYIIIRYFIGGVEWVTELVNSITVLSFASITAAMSLGASGFKNLGAKIGTFSLLFFSTYLGGAISIAGTGVWLLGRGRSTPSGTSYTLFNTCCLIVVACYVMICLLVARSKLRVALFQYEFKPSNSLLIIIAISPFMIGMAAALTCGFGSIFGLIFVTFLIWNSDKTPKFPKTIKPPTPNIPPPPVLKRRTLSE